MFGQPVAALRQGLRLAEHFLHFGSGAFRQQVMVNPQLNFATNPHRQTGEHVQRVYDSPIRRVFQRHDAELSVAATKFLKHGGDGGHRGQLTTLAKMVDRGEIRVAVLRPEVGHADRAAPQPGSRLSVRGTPRGPLVIQRPAVGLAHFRQALLLHGRMQRLPVPRPAGPLNKLGPLVNQPQ